MSGLDAAERILASDPSARILFLTTFSDDAYIIRALKMGARGYLLKQNYESIVPSLKAVYNGQSVFGDEIVSRIPDMCKKTAGLISQGMASAIRKPRSSPWWQRG